MKKAGSWIGWLIALAILIALIWFGRNRVHFNWSVFVRQLRYVSWTRIAVATALIWLGYGIRAVRWALLMQHQKRVRSWTVLGSQVIGFTGVALFGRLADLVRPYLVSRRTSTPLASQVAVYAVERTFDMGSMALIFSTVLLFGPGRNNLPRPELIHHAAMAGLVATLALVAFAVVARISGGMAAAFAGRALGLLSPRLGASVSDKILAFRDGLNATASVREFLFVLVLSLVMWAMIAGSYLETTRAFTASPPLAGMTLARCMLLMAASMGSSLVQLPVIGWFTQIAFAAATMQALFQASSESALGCGAMLLLVTYMSVVPVGLIWARFEHVSVKRIARESEHAGEELAHDPNASAQQA